MDYQLSFTAAGLCYHETRIIAELFLEDGNWSRVQSKVFDDNLLQKSTVATAKREFSEIKKRLSTFTSEQLQAIARADLTELKLLTLLSCIKAYRLLYDFMIEVLRTKVQMFDLQILESDWANFIEAKRQHIPKVGHASEATLKKIRQVVFKMLSDADIIDDIKTKIIQPPILNGEFTRLVCVDEPHLLAAFLISDSDIRSLCEGSR